MLVNKRLKVMEKIIKNIKSKIDETKLFYFEGGKYWGLYVYDASRNSSIHRFSELKSNKKLKR